MKFGPAKNLCHSDSLLSFISDSDSWGEIAISQSCCEAYIECVRAQCEEGVAFSPAFVCLSVSVVAA